MTSGNVEGISSTGETPVREYRGHRKVVNLYVHKKHTTRKERKQKPKLDPKRVLTWLGVVSGVLSIVKLLVEIIKLINPN